MKLYQLTDFIFLLYILIQLCCYVILLYFIIDNLFYDYLIGVIVIGIIIILSNITLIIYLIVNKIKNNDFTYDYSFIIYSIIILVIHLLVITILIIDLFIKFEKYKILITTLVCCFLITLKIVLLTINYNQKNLKEDDNLDGVSV